MKRPGGKILSEKIGSFCLDHPKIVALIVLSGTFLLTFTDLILETMEHGLSYLLDPMKMVIYIGYPALTAFFIFLFLKTKKESIKDDLTKLFNARYLHIMLDKTIQRAKVEGFPLSLLFIDIDNFKGYNDKYGHLAGDLLLARFGHLLYQCTRNDADSAYRYGGDEFIVILAGADLNNAAFVAERIQETFAEEDFDDLSLSIGLTAFKEDYTREFFLKSADAAMYKAKNAGKDQLYIYIA